ncbi:MAG: DUF423 domain-containing protein [Flavobacteriaceae bacterium]
MNKTILGTGIFFGVTAIILGAFGAHGLKENILPEALQSYKTGVQYQMYHALFLLILGVMNSLSARDKKLVFYLITTGVVFFSFSIYILSTSAITGLNIGGIGLITPIGGVLLILGWLILGYRIYKQLN